MPAKQDRELGVFAVALAHQNGAFAVFYVADALAFFQIGGASGGRNVHGCAGKRTGLVSASFSGEEAGDVVDGVRVGGASLDPVRFASIENF